MQVGIAGAGAVAIGYAGYLLERGHIPEIWSPSGRGTKAFETCSVRLTGMVECTFQPQICGTARELAKNDVIVIALPANGHRVVLDALAPHLEERHSIIISGHLSFAGLYLSKILADRGLKIPICAWSTTALTAKFQDSPTEVRVGIVRKNIDMAVLPSQFSEKATSICVDLFGPCFSLKEDLLTISLSNLNPQNHLAIALCNLTRIEQGERWHQNSNITPLVGNLLLELDNERISIGRAVGREIRTLAENFKATLGISGGSVAEMYQIQARRGNDPFGPTDSSTRYVLEDVPYGLVPLVMLADLTSTEVPLHRSGIQILGACYGRDFSRENNLLAEIDIRDLNTLRQLAADGYAVAN